MKKLKLEISLVKDEHPGCFGRDCEGEHFENNVHIRVEDNVFVFTEGTEEADMLERILRRIMNAPKGMDAVLLYAKAECPVCPETFHVQRMLSDLEHALATCKHNKPSK